MLPLLLSFRYFLPSNSSALELVLWSFGSHLAPYDWSSYHLTLLYTPNIYRPIDTPWGGIYTTLHMEMISINYHSPLTRQRGGGETKEPRQQEHFSGVMCTMCNEQRKGHLTHFCQNEFIYFKHLILQSPHWCTAWQWALRGCITTSGGFSFLPNS